MRIVVFSEVKWSYMRTRKRFMISCFPADWRILFLEPMNLQARSHWRPVRDGQVTVATLPVLKPSTSLAWLNRLLGWGLFRALVNRVVGCWLGLLLRWWGGNGPRVFYLANVIATPVARRFARDLFLYDCNDHPLGFRTTPGWVAAYLDQTLEVADHVVSCSRALAQRLRQRQDRHVEVIGNGVEYEHFAAPVAEERVLPAIRELGRPRIGYAGAISNWFDFDLVAAVARSQPDVPVILMGPVAPDVAARAAALRAAQANVRFTGAIPYEDLPHQVGSLDVCLIPFLLGGETDVLNPNKLYEYLAAGRPVVTLRYSEDIESFADCVLLAGSRDEFVARVAEALATPPDPDRLRGIARQHSWGARADAMVRLIRTGVDRTRADRTGTGRTGTGRTGAGRTGTEVA